MSELSIEAAAAEAPARCGLIADGRAYSFAELAARARDVAPAPGQVVTLVAERDLGTALALYAALERRAPVILLHARATAPERARMQGLCAALAPDPALAAVLFTSGSSGAHKAVLLDRSALVASAAASAAHLGWRPDDRWLCALPLAHIGGLSILTRCLIARRCAVLDTGARFDPRRVADLVVAARVTLLSLVPTQLVRLLDAGWTAPPHLRALLLGGQAAPASLLERAADRGVPALVTYGMTETCSQVCTQIPGTRVTRPGLCGPPLPGVELRIHDGRILVRGPMLMRGYLGAPAPIDADGWLDTGDRGAWAEHGALQVLGRDDDTLITGGENVHPREVEAALEAHPGVAAACVFGVPDPTWGQIVAAAVVPAPGHALDRAELADFLASRLATHRRPRLLCTLPALPLGATGKVDRGQTAARARDRLRPLP